MTETKTKAAVEQADPPEQREKIQKEKAASKIHDDAHAPQDKNQKIEGTPSKEKSAALEKGGTTSATNIQGTQSTHLETVVPSEVKTQKNLSYLDNQGNVTSDAKAADPTKPVGLELKDQQGRVVDLLIYANSADLNNNKPQAQEHFKFSKSSSYDIENRQVFDFSSGKPALIVDSSKSTNSDTGYIRIATRQVNGIEQTTEFDKSGRPIALSRTEGKDRYDIKFGKDGQVAEVLKNHTALGGDLKQKYTDTAVLFVDQAQKELQSFQSRSNNAIPALNLVSTDNVQTISSATSLSIRLTGKTEGSISTELNRPGKPYLTELSAKNSIPQPPDGEITQPKIKENSVESMPSIEMQYKVRKGDNVWSIAERVVNEEGHLEPNNKRIASKSQEIIEKNGLNENGRSPDFIVTGEILTIPVSAATTVPEVTPQEETNQTPSVVPDQAQTAEDRLVPQPEPKKNTTPPVVPDKAPPAGETTVPQPEPEKNTTPRVVPSPAPTAGERTVPQPDQTALLDDRLPKTDPNETESVSSAPRLDAKTTKLIADDLHEALEKKTLFVNTPDSEKVLRLLGSRNSKDYEDIENTFKRSYPESDLRTTLKARLPETDYRKAEALLNTEDGRTNDAGNLMVGLTAAKNDRHSGQTQVLESVATLNSQQLQQLKLDFKQHYNTDVEQSVANSPDVSPETKQAFQILMRGIEKRTPEDIKALANLAVETKDLDLAKIALRGDSNQAKELRSQLSEDDSFQAKYKEAFGDEQAAKDILKDGRISISTIVSNNTGKIFFLNNKENLLSTLDQSTDYERKSYSTGRDLALTGGVPKTPEEKSALEYYTKVHKALDDGGNDRELAVWEDHLLYEGGSIVSRLASKHNNGWTDDGGLGSGHNTKELIAATQLTKSDWERLKDPASGPAFRKSIEESLKTYTADKERQFIVDLIDKKVAVPFEQSAKVNPDILRLMEFTSINGKADGQLFAQSIAGLSPAEIAKYKNNTDGFRSNLDNIVNGLHGENLLFSKRILNQIDQTGRIDIEGDPTANVLKNSIDRADAGKSLTDYQRLIEDKTVLARLNKPENEMSDEDKILKSILTRTIQSEAFAKGATTNQAIWASEDATRATLATGKIPLDVKLWLDMPRKGLYAEVAQRPEAERANLLKYLNEDEKKLVENARNQNGQTTLADDLRSFVIGDGSKYQSFEDQLKALSPQQKQDLKKEYQSKYGSLDDQFLARVDRKDKVQFRNYLDPAISVDGRQDYYDNLRERLKSDSGFSADGSGLSVERASILHAEELQKFQSQFKNLPADKQELLNKQFAESIEQYRESKGKLKEIVVDATITTAAIVAAPFSGGISLTGLSYVAASGAAFRLAAAKVIEGDDFNSSPENVLKELLTGGTTAATAFIGPEAILGLTNVGKVAAKNTAKVLATTGSRELLKEGGEVVLEQNLKQVFGNAVLTGKEITLQDLDKITTAVVKQNATKAEREALRETIKSTFARELKDESKRSLRESVEQYAKVQARESLNNGIVGSVSNVAGDVVAAPFSKDGLNADKLRDSAFSGLVVGAILPVAFKAAVQGTTAAKDLIVNVTKGVDNHLYIHPERNGRVKIKHSDGTETVVEPGQKEPYKLKNGDNVLEAGALPEKPLGEIKAEVLPVRDEYDLRRVLRVDGKDYAVNQEPPQMWFYGPKNPPYDSPVKVHITTDSAEDLGKLQKIVIPALIDDPELRDLARWWKTFDPKHGVGETGVGKRPNGKDNYGKAFTIYADTPENAVKLQAKLDSLLERRGLSLETPHNTNNVDHIYGKSNRVGITLDTPEQVLTAGKNKVAKIQDQVVEAIHKDLNVPVGQKFTQEQLNQIEKKAGIRKGTLVYSEHGELALKPVSGNSSPDYFSGIYLDESGADKAFGHKTDRPAYYALAKTWNLDPGEIRAGVVGKS
jgi:hypothetical protein